jgi:hypothetical protein
MRTGQRSLEALLTLSGQNTFNLEALVDLLISKEIITAEELDAQTEAQYLDKHPSVTPAEWARRHIDREDGEALNTFFVEGVNCEPPRGGWAGRGKISKTTDSPITITHGPRPEPQAPPAPRIETVLMGGTDVPGSRVRVIKPKGPGG